MRWRAFPLHPETPPEGRLLKDLFAGKPVDIEAMVARLQKTAAALGLPFGSGRSITYNSRLAQEVGLWAESQGAGERFHMAAFQAYFVNGANLYQTEVLLDLAQRAGLPQKAAQEVITKRTFKAAVDADWALSRRLGIRAVPTLVLDKERLVGAQPYEVMAAMLEQQGTPRRNE